jgi:hypothetical protein
MPKANYWVNGGLAVGFGRRTVDDALPGVVNTAGVVKQLILELEDLTTLPLNTAVGTITAGSVSNAALIPANASVQSVTIITKTAATSGGAADLLLGVYTINATTGALVAVDEDGLAAATDSALADFSAAGETIVLGKAANAALVGKLTVGSSPVVVAAAYATAAYTAGALQVIVEYVDAA